MTVLAEIVTYVVIWAAFALSIAFIYWLWVVLVLDPLWQWKQRHRRTRGVREEHQRALAEVNAHSAVAVRRLAEQYDLARNEIRRQAGRA